MSDDPFHSSKRKVERAKHHFGELHRDIKAFLESKPYALFIEPDTDGVHEFKKLKLVKPLPPALGEMVSDAANNLRDALDQTIFAVYVCMSVSVGESSFPISNNAVYFEKALTKKCNGFPTELLDLIRKFEPYKGGDGHLLWALNKLANPNKHATISAIASASGDIRWEFEATDVPAGQSLTFKIPVWNPTKNEMVLSRVPVGGIHKDEFHLTLFVAFRDGEFVKGKPVLNVISAFIRKVESVVMAIEAEARRLGLV